MEADGHVNADQESSYAKADPVTVASIASSGTNDTRKAHFENAEGGTVLGVLEAGVAPESAKRPRPRSDNRRSGGRDGSVMGADAAEVPQLVRELAQLASFVRELGSGSQQQPLSAEEATLVVIAFEGLGAARQGAAYQARSVGADGTGSVFRGSDPLWGAYRSLCRRAVEGCLVPSNSSGSGTGGVGGLSKDRAISSKRGGLSLKKGSPGQRQPRTPLGGGGRACADLFKMLSSLSRVLCVASAEPSVCAPPRSDTQKSIQTQARSDTQKSIQTQVRIDYDLHAWRISISF